MSIAALLTAGLQATGVTLLLLAAAHAYLDTLLSWRADLAKLKPINKEVFWAHTIFLIGGIALLGISCLFFAADLVARSHLAAVASACFALCWLSRLVCQFVLFKGEITGKAELDQFLRVSSTLLWTFYTLLFATLFAYQIGYLS
jgi:hypothetical protein